MTLSERAYHILNDLGMIKGPTYVTVSKKDTKPTPLAEEPSSIEQENADNGNKPQTDVTTIKGNDEPQMTDKVPSELTPTAEPKRKSRRQRILKPLKKLLSKNNDRTEVGSYVKADDSKAEEYAQIDDLEERAYTILKDLGMLENDIVVDTK